MSKNDNTHTPNRLKELMKQHGITETELADKLTISVSTVRSYINGSRNIPSPTAIVIADFFHVSLDYLFFRQAFANERDIMIEIVKTLDSVLHIEMRKENGYFIEPILFIERNFGLYLRDIQNLEWQKNRDNICDEAYKTQREAIFLKYKDFIKETFSSETFNVEKAIELKGIEELPQKETILDLISPAIEE